MFIAEEVHQVSGSSCEVECREGYFACCNRQACKCLRDGSDGSLCLAGGEGAVKCRYDSRTELE